MKKYRILAGASNIKALDFLDQIISRQFTKRIFLLNKGQKNKTLQKINLFFWYFFIINRLLATGINLKFSFKVSQLNPKVRKFIILLCKIKLYKISKKLDKIIFSNSDQVIREINLLRPQLLVVSGSAMDTMSFLGIRTAKQKNIKSLMIVTHWDFFSKKGILRENPDFLFVWGDQMRKNAMAQGFPKNKIFKIGFPVFDLDKKYFFQTKKRRQKNFPTLLFAGAGAPFDEEGALRGISTVLAKKKLKSRLTYRPHPRGLFYNKDDKFNNEISRMGVEIRMPYSNENELLATRKLLREASAVITPASTMLLESGCYGLPSLCLVYDDGVYDHIFPFSFALESEHIKAVQQNPYIIFCRRKEDLEAKMNELLLLVKKNPDPWKVRRSFNKVLENTGRQSSKALAEKALKKIFATHGSLEHNNLNEPSCNFN